MAWPSSPVAVGDVITNTQLNLLPIRIADTTLGSSQSSIDLSSLPGNFAHLLIVASCRGDSVAPSQQMLLRLNGDSAANYDYWNLKSGSAITVTDIQPGATSIVLGEFPCANAPAAVFGSHVIEILDYTNGSKQRAVHCSSVAKLGTSTGQGVLYDAAGHWRSASAVTEITIIPAAGNFVTNSRLTVYGLA